MVTRAVNKRGNNASAVTEISDTSKVLSLHDFNSSLQRLRNFFLETRFMSGVEMVFNVSPVSLFRSTMVSSSPRSCVDQPAPLRVDRTDVKAEASAK
jgi:hypothetical protein